MKAMPKFGIMRKCFGLLLIGWLLTLDANTQDSLVFTPTGNQPVQSIYPYLRVFEDRDKSLTSGQVFSDQGINFLPVATFTELNPKSAWWFKLDIKPSFSLDSFFIGLPPKQSAGLQQGNDRVDVWIVQEGKARHYEVGIITPLSKRPVVRPVNRNIFPLAGIENRAATIYWRIERTVNYEPVQADFALQHATLLQSQVSAFDKGMWFYTGVMLILFIFGLVFSIITKEKSFLSFTVAAALFCAHALLLNSENNFVSWLTPGAPGLQWHFFSLFTASFVLFIIQFARVFGETARIMPRWDRFIKAVMLTLAVVTVMDILRLQFMPAAEFPVFVVILIFAGFIAIAVKLATSSYLYAKWAGLAILWLFVFQILGVLWNMGVIPASFPNPWFISQVGMMILLFFALAYRFRQSAREKAEAAKILELDEIKSRFFANISHEFRTPLTLMLGPLKQMEETGTDESQRKRYVAMMRRNGDRLLQLINQLLDLSKLESGKMDLKVSKTDITAFLKTIAASFESLAEQNQVNYHIHFPEENIFGFIDRDKLEKIVVNLLSNAFRFTAANGSVSFSVDTDGKRVRLTVQDDGVGIPREQLNRIFDRFHQVAGTEGGTGIGLALAKELLQLHKGQVSVQSEAGKGSSFRISVPIAQEFYSSQEVSASNMGDLPAFEKADTGLPGVEIVEEAAYDTSLPLVLVVEDNPDLQQYIADTLRSQFHVKIAGNGKLGLQQATELIPDCIISDVMMPEMDGITMCARLKKESVTSHIPVILLTAKAGSGSRIEGLQTGADDYLVKPFDSAELIVRVKNLIEQRKQLRERYSREVISVQPDQVEMPSVEHDFIQQVRAVIEENIDNELFGVIELANAIHLSRSQLHRKLKSLTGQAPNELIRNYRLERAHQLLGQKTGTVTEIAYQTGFSSPAYFSKCFADRYGFSPGDLRKKGDHATG